MKFIRWIIKTSTNLFLGIIAPALIATQLSGKQAISTGQKISVGFHLGTFGILAWIVLIFLYFYLAKHYIGQSLGGKLADLLTGHQSHKQK